MFKIFMLSFYCLLLISIVVIGGIEVYTTDPLRNCVVTDRWSDADIYSCKDGVTRWVTVPTR